ncbi:MAG: hypothetical protein QXO15_01600 [Nitrososphaerota archaeon]
MMSGRIKSKWISGARITRLKAPSINVKLPVTATNDKIIMTT